jgi:predicted dehydrogenase
MSPSQEQTNVCVVGAGGWGRNHVRTFATMQGSLLRAVCDSDPKIQALIGRQYPTVNVTGEFGDVLTDASIQAVVIATPAPNHAEMAERALEAGKHVFVEKPLALTVAEADRVLAAKPPGRTLMVGHLLLFHPVVQRLKDMIRAGELGDVLYIYTQRLNLGVVRRDENAWWSLAPHDISLVLHFFDEEPIEISAMGACYLQPDVEDVVFAALRFPSGRVAKIHVSWLDPHKERKVVVVGSSKMAVFDDMAPAEKLRIFDKGVHVNQPYEHYSEWITIRSGDVVSPSIRQVEPLAVECRHFLDCIHAGTEPLTGGDSGRRVTAVLEQVQRQLDRSRLSR